ncbi:MAG: hypothetical protein ACYC4T_03945 [Melioribacteraceae bacterium]
MKNFRYIVFFFLIAAMHLFSQTVRDTSKTSRQENKSDRKQILQKIPDDATNQFELPDVNIFIPLNLKIYQKAIINNYNAPHKFTREELSTGMADDELISLEVNKSKTKRMLSELYGEDLIDMKKVLETLGITKEQITWIVAILRFFLQQL